MNENQYLPEGALFGRVANRSALACMMGIETAMHDRRVLEAPVTLCDSHMRLHVDLGCMEGIIEPEEALLCRPGECRKDIALITRVGKPTCFVVMGIEHREGVPVAILSRKEAQKRCLEEYLLHLREGDVIAARVTHTEPFGAFLDIGCGVSSLLSVDCISVSRISHPGDRLARGEEIRVVVKSIDRETGRIYTTLKELLGTWEENAAQFEVGQTVPGIVRSVESYGVFVELTPNLAGLAECRSENAEQMRGMIGKCVAVYIKSMIPERMKIKLVIVDPTATEPQTRRLRYYVDTRTTQHIARWIYSPAGASRRIETVFKDATG